MEDNKPELDNDSDIIMIEEVCDTVVIGDSSPEKTPFFQDKPKKKKMKKQSNRKVKLKVNQRKEIETLMITQKVQGKRAKLSCVININTVCEERKSDSIIRFDRNEWKKEAYYGRIVPLCLRTHCFSHSICKTEEKSNISKTGCCRAARNQEDDRFINLSKVNGVSPVSSAPFTEVENDISYEEVSNGNFSSSEDELETLIKRTKEREKQLYPQGGNVYSAPLFASTPIPHEDLATSDMSLSSSATLVLAPEAYSPTGLNFEHEYTPYPLSMSPDFIDVHHNGPYSPTDPTMTPPRDEDIKIEDGIKQYSHASPLWVDINIEGDNKKSAFVADLKKEIDTEAKVFPSFLIKTEKSEVKGENENESDLNVNFQVYVKAEKQS